MAKGVSWSYDDEVDVLYIVIGKNAPAEAFEIADNVYARVEPKSKRLVGLTIVGFKSRFKALGEKMQVKLPE